MHPYLCDGVSVNAAPGGYIARNAQGGEFRLSYPVYRELLQADGTHPLQISESALNILKRGHILSTSRYVSRGAASRFILFPLSERISRFRPLCRVINALLPILAFVLFAYAWKSPERRTFYFGNLDWKIYCALFALSIVVHELAHLVAGIAYGYRNTDAGILLAYVIPYGAYVAHQEPRNAPRGERLQLYLAGIEANLLLTAILMLLAQELTMLDLTYATAARFNLILALVNLLPIGGLDGEAALSALLGVRSVSANAKRFFSSRSYRRTVLRSGLRGYLCAACYLASKLCSAGLSALVFLNITNLLRGW